MNYADTVAESLRKESSEEIAARIRGGYLTDEAVIIAQQILKERGIDLASIPIEHSIYEQKNNPGRDVAKLFIKAILILAAITFTSIIGMMGKDFIKQSNSLEKSNALFPIIILLFIIGWTVYSYFKFIPNEAKSYSVKKIFMQALSWMLFSVLFMWLIISGTMNIDMVYKFPSFEFFIAAFGVMSIVHCLRWTTELIKKFK